MILKVWFILFIFYHRLEYWLLVIGYWLLVIGSEQQITNNK